LKLKNFYSKPISEEFKELAETNFIRNDIRMSSVM